MINSEEEQQNAIKKNKKKHYHFLKQTKYQQIAGFLGGITILNKKK